MWLSIGIALACVLFSHPPAIRPPAAAVGPSTGYLPLAGRGFCVTPPPLLISALFYDTYVSGEPDEAFQLYNPQDIPAELQDWQLLAGRRSVTFPAGLTIGARETLWCARSAAAFAASFGAAPACEYGDDSDAGVPNLIGSAPQFGNTGGRLELRSPGGQTMDVLVYEGGDAAPPGWSGPAVLPYHPSSSFGVEGQVLYRKLDQRTGLPVPDTGTAADWAQDPKDVIDGRRARYPGWEVERFALPGMTAERAGLQVIVSPDHSYAALAALLEEARASIRFEGYTFESAALGEIVAARARAGVDVEMLLEGSPAGGVSDQQRWIVHRIASGGGRVYYMRSDADADIRARYLFQHAKFWILDGRLAVVGTENAGPEGFPDDDKSDGTSGQRGIAIVTDAASVIGRLSALFADDLGAGRHADIWSWTPGDPQLGAPPEGFTPDFGSGGSFYPVRFPRPLTAEGLCTFQVIQGPEQSMRSADGLLGLVGRAGAGDVILVEQLYEQTYWGAESSNVTSDPNPRLEAYINAARRGARVRVLLDAYYDDEHLDSGRSNLRTLEYLAAIARAEELDLEARRANPTGLGLHNKMVLAHIGGRGWTAVGSLNGSEVSAKLNREAALIVGSDEVCDYLAQVFWSDWSLAP